MNDRDAYIEALKRHIGSMKKQGFKLLSVRIAELEELLSMIESRPPLEWPEIEPPVELVAEERE